MTYSFEKPNARTLNDPISFEKQGVEVPSPTQASAQSPAPPTEYARGNPSTMTRRKQALLKVGSRSAPFNRRSSAPEEVELWNPYLGDYNLKDLQKKLFLSHALATKLGCKKNGEPTQLPASEPVGNNVTQLPSQQDSDVIEQSNDLVLCKSNHEHGNQGEVTQGSKGVEEVFQEVGLEDMVQVVMAMMTGDPGTMALSSPHPPSSNTDISPHPHSSGGASLDRFCREKGMGSICGREHEDGSNSDSSGGDDEDSILTVDPNKEERESPRRYQEQRKPARRASLELLWKKKGEDGVTQDSSKLANNHLSSHGTMATCPLCDSNSVFGSNTSSVVSGSSKETTASTNDEDQEVGGGRRARRLFSDFLFQREETNRGVESFSSRDAVVADSLKCVKTNGSMEDRRERRQQTGPNPFAFF